MSDSRLDTKIEVPEIAATGNRPDLNHPQNSLNLNGINKIIFDYLDFDNSILLQKPFTFFSISSIPEQIKNLVYYAAPLDQVEALIRRQPNILLKTFENHSSQGTLLQFAIIGLDQRRRKFNLHTQLREEVSDEGMVEKLLYLHHEFEDAGQLPAGSFEQAIKLAHEAAPIEKDNEAEAREQANKKAVRLLFDAFVHIPTDENLIDVEIENFKVFVKNLKRQMTVNGKMTTNRYHLNLIHLISCAFAEFCQRGARLPGYHYGALADCFCFKIIGAVLEAELKTAPRVQQILINKTDTVLTYKKETPRVVDINAAVFYSRQPSWSQKSLVLGVNSCYDLGFAERSVQAQYAQQWFQNFYKDTRFFRFMPRPRRVLSRSI